MVGESGSGKSVTAMSIMRLIEPPAGEIVTGEVIFNGTNLLALSEDEMQEVRGGQIAMIFQDPMTALNPVYTIGDQLIGDDPAPPRREPEPGEGDRHAGACTMCRFPTLRSDSTTTLTSSRAACDSA